LSYLHPIELSVLWIPTLRQVSTSALVSGCRRAYSTEAADISAASADGFKPTCKHASQVLCASQLIGYLLS
jgi:hypothetical protein